VHLEHILTLFFRSATGPTTLAVNSPLIALVATPAPEMEATNQEMEATNPEMEATNPVAVVAVQEMEATNQEMEATNPETEATNPVAMVTVQEMEATTMTLYLSPMDAQRTLTSIISCLMRATAASSTTAYMDRK